jgi:hypothetical protein
MNYAAKDKSWKRISRLLPARGDFTLIVLKGHLLIEEQLSAIIVSQCRRPVRIEEVRLSFIQKLRMVDALTESFSDSEISLNAIERLNAVRNKMAHNTDVHDMNQKIDDYLRASAPDGFVDPKTSSERMKALRACLIFQIGFLEGIVRAHNLIRNGKKN